MKIKPGSFLYAIGVWYHFWKLAAYPLNRPSWNVLRSSIRAYRNTRKKS